MKRIPSTILPALAAALLLAAATGPASAHLDPVEHGSLAAGLSHPFSGLDHVLAMVTVGLWAALLGGRAVWLVPTAFVAAMLAGFAAALGGVALPFVEPVVSASVVVVGLLAATALRVPTGIGMALVGLVAFFHGHAHGGELGAAGAASFSAGFAVATAILHAVGVGLGVGPSRVAGGGAGRLLARVAGGGAALAGALLLVGAAG